MNALKTFLTEWQKAHPETKPSPPKCLPTYRPEKREIVAGGEILWKPINREAAKLLSKASWLSQPPETALRNYDKKLNNTQHDSTPRRDAKGNNSSPHSPRAKLKKRKTKSMKEIASVSVIQQDHGFQSNPNQNFHTNSGVRIKMINGQKFFYADDVKAMICEQINNLHKETRPNVKAAEDARKIINELTEGISEDMGKFRSDTKRYLEDIRSTRFAMVTEAAHMTGPLKEVRQFFLGGDYKEEITRLKDFVDLCERLQKLKESGFLDSVADTMLGLAMK